MGDKTTSRKRESTWLTFVSGEVCPAFGWKNIFRRTHDRLATAYASGIVGVGAAVFGSLPENIAATSFGSVGSLDLALAMKIVAERGPNPSPDMSGIIKEAYDELALPNVGLLVVTHVNEHPHEYHYGPPLTEDAQSNLIMHADLILKQCGISITTPSFAQLQPAS